ncbi:hypothetical protein CJ030_MR5G005111 [Morella rubra]|uniref:Uncharacterized protein n=1 Tax=Morella rubra TaxID=262757 RepID=A0A6A1VK37_9ROSI|nr:hypothetical protein CJ030_MR5G005111 [Morella rubra]
MDHHCTWGDLSVVTGHPSSIYGTTEADWSIPYSGDGEQARCRRHLPYFHGQNMVLVGPFVRQKFMLPFWRILHLIFAYDIESRAHTTECPILRGKLMLAVATRYVVDLPRTSS